MTGGYTAPPPAGGHSGPGWPTPGQHGPGQPAPAPRSARLLAAATVAAVVLICGAVVRSSLVAGNGQEVDLAGVEATGTGDGPPATAGTAPPTTEPPAAPVEGGEVVDLSAFALGPPEHIDPLMAYTTGGRQVAGLLYDGLTDVDPDAPGDADDPVVRGAVAESWESNEDATEWTFTLRDGLSFSDGTPVLPSSFARGWEIGSDLGEGATYSYLYLLIEGGPAAGVEADDEAMTLTVSLAWPEAELPAIMSHGAFHPMPAARDDLGDQAAWGTGDMVGNGPFVLETAWDGASDVTLVPNPEWDGTRYDGELDLPEQPHLDRVTFRASTDEDTAYEALRAGEGDVAPIPAGRAAEASATFATLDGPRLGSYFFQFNDRDERVGGDGNLLLRRAVVQAIDRERLVDLVYEGLRDPASGVAPPGTPGFTPDLCSQCSYDPAAAEADLQAWLDEGNTLDEPLPIQFNEGVGHEPVVDMIVDDLGAVGIEAEPDGRPTADYFADMTAGDCVICRSGWIADYPAYGNFTYDLFHSAMLNVNNFGFDDPEFDAVVTEAQGETDPEVRTELFREAERVLLDDQVGVIPVTWYRGAVAYDGDSIANLVEDPMFHIRWETAHLSG